MFGLVTSSGMETLRREAPIRVRANLPGARVVSRLGYADLTGADLHQADFIGANLAGANLMGAIATGTNFEAAEIKNAIELDSVKGLDRTGSH